MIQDIGETIPIDQSAIYYPLFTIPVGITITNAEFIDEKPLVLIDDEVLGLRYCWKSEVETPIKAMFVRDSLLDKKVRETLRRKLKLEQFKLTPAF